MPPIRPRIREYRLTKPRAIREAFYWAVEAGFVENHREEWDEFLWQYKRNEGLPPHLR